MLFTMVYSFFKPTQYEFFTGPRPIHMTVNSDVTLRETFSSWCSSLQLKLKRKKLEILMKLFFSFMLHGCSALGRSGE